VAVVGIEVCDIRAFSPLSSNVGTDVSPREDAKSKISNWSPLRKSSVMYTQTGNSSSNVNGPSGGNQKNAGGTAVEARGN
jgi:hypothetical protein